MLRASDRSSFLLAIATALALGGLGQGAVARAQAPAPDDLEPEGPGTLPRDARPPIAGRAGSFPYHLPGRELLIPSNGALPIESFIDDHPVVEVKDGTGTAVPGLLHDVGVSDHGIILAWVPSAPLSIGTLSVALTSPFDSTLARVQHVRVVAPFTSDLPAIDMEVSASLVELPEWRECCFGVAGGPPHGCFTRNETYARVEPGFTSPVQAAFRNQYLFRIKPAPGSVKSDADKLFMPFEQVDAARFLEPAAEYCLQVEALRIATREVLTYPKIACTPGVEDVGKLDVAEDHLAYEACPLPPDNEIARWCEVNPNLCQTEDPEACAIHEHVCSGAPAPPIIDVLRNGQVFRTRVALADQPSPAEPKACSAAPARTRASLFSLLWLSALAALVRRRKR